MGMTCGSVNTCEPLLHDWNWLFAGLYLHPWSVPYVSVEWPVVPVMFTIANALISSCRASLLTTKIYSVEATTGGSTEKVQE